MIVIPARLNSTRLKDKILLDIFGVPMFIATANNASKIDSVLIAVDDENVYKIAKEHGFDVVMTDINHQSGTDRINEAVSKMGLKDSELIINVQADEPFFEISNLLKFKKFASQKIEQGSFMASCFKMVSKDEAKDPNLVKVVIDENFDAMYFSRSLIPYPRNECELYKAHIGIYAYSVATLREFCSFLPSFLENTEKLEQLRALQNCKKISMLEIFTTSIGIDCKEDYQRAIKAYREASLYEQ